MKTITNCKIITDGKIISGYDILIRDKKIVSIEKSADISGPKIDLGGKYISAGFIDLHCHGGGGAEFIDATPEAFKTAAAVHAAHGTRVMYPTISSADYDTMARALECAKKVKNDCAVEIPGIHLEGPYLSLEMCGGQSPGTVREINPNEYSLLMEKYGDIIARWDYAPEKDRDCAFVNALCKNGIIPATAHSSAEYDDVKRAYSHGNRLVTHLYSCTSTVTRRNGFRHLGVVESAYLIDGIYVEAIADGCHLPAELLRMIVKIKGDDRVCLVTDALRPGGADKNQEGRAFTGSAVPFVIEDGVAKLLDRSAFAGSIATADRLLQTAVKADIGMASAVRMLTETPARVMGLAAKGRIAKGYDAQFSVFDDKLNVSDIDI